MADILILHGWGSRAKNWSRVKEILEEHGHKVFAPDLPGFGENPAPQKSWAIDDYVDWVEQYVDQNLTGPFYLIGHSFGGTLSVRLADDISGKIKKLILVAPKIKSHRAVQYYIALILAKIGNMIFSLPGLFFLQPIARKVLYYIVGTRDYYKLEVKKAVSMKQTFKQIVGTDSTELISAIQVPVLIIWGKNDKITPLGDAYFIHRQIKNSTLEIIDGVGHEINLKAPEILAEKIINFLM